MEQREEERTIQNLKDAGCSESTIHEFLTCCEQGDYKEQMCILSSHRKCLLDEIHKGQKEIDCLDYLVYQMEKRENGERKPERKR